MMKHSFKKILVFSTLAAFLMSCNTYQWQRKRYYKSNRNKNWNNYNVEKTKKEDENQLNKYYRK